MGFIQYSMIFGDIPLTLGARAIQLKAADAAQREGKPPTAQTPAAYGKRRAPAPRSAARQRAFKVPSLPRAAPT